MKLTIDLPQNYVEAYQDMLQYLNYGETVERAIAREAKELVRHTLFQSWEMLDWKFVFPCPKGLVQDRGLRIAERIIQKHNLKETE